MKAMTTGEMASSDTLQPCSIVSALTPEVLFIEDVARVRQTSRPAIDQRRIGQCAGASAVEHVPPNQEAAGSASRGFEQSPWLTVHEAAARAKCGIKTIYRDVQAGRLRAARIGGRRELRLLVGWVDEWLIGSTAVMLRRSE